MYLVVGDLHLTDQAKDAYRFGIFEWIRQQQQKYKPQATIILGDLTHHKDNHSSLLVNNIIDKLDKLERPIYILRGNHDGIDPNTPYFKFINKIEGLVFFTAPQLLDNIAAIPHCRSQDEFDQAIWKVGNKKVDICILHNTINGASSETGHKLSGLSLENIHHVKTDIIVAGDIHKPQQCGPVIYVGSPYNIRFGDDFEPRCLLLDKGKATNLYYDCPRKWVLKVRSAEEIFRNANLIKGDHVKITLELAREEAVEWQKQKQEVLDVCAKRGLEVYGVEMKVATRKATQVTGSQTRRTHSQVLDAFCTVETLASQVKKAGHRILNE